MGHTNEGIRRWLPLEWFLEGWHDAFDERAVAGDPEGAKAMDQVFGGNLLQPGWITELERVSETSFPDVMYQVTGSLIPVILRSILEEHNLDECGSLLRGCAAFGIVTNNYFHGRTTVPRYQGFLDKLQPQLVNLGAVLAEQMLASPSRSDLLRHQLIVVSPKGIEHREDIKPGQSPHPSILALQCLSPRSLILEMGSNIQLGHIRTHDDSILTYPLGLEHLFALACSTTGRFNPVGLGVEELWRSQRYFPLIGSLSEPTDEIENGLSWWRITNPQIAPLPVGLGKSTY